MDILIFSGAYSNIGISRSSAAAIATPLSLIHIYGYEKAENRLCHLPDYFPSERNSCWKKSLVERGLNYQGIPTLENAAYEFETYTWGKLLLISLEFAPRDEAIEWAAKVAGKAKYKNHKVILLTHSYMSCLLYTSLIPHVSVV